MTKLNMMEKELILNSIGIWMVIENTLFPHGSDMWEHQPNLINWSSDLHQMNPIQEKWLMVIKCSHYGRLKITIMNSVHTPLKRRINSMTLSNQLQSIKNHNNCGHSHILDTTMKIWNTTWNGQIVQQLRNSKDYML